MKRILLISLLLLAVICTVSADRRRLLMMRDVASAAYSPSDTANLFAWYKSDALVTNLISTDVVAEGTNIIAWGDSSGNGRHLTTNNPTASAQLFKGTAATGKAQGGIERITQFLRVGFTAQPDTTCFVVWRIATGATVAIPFDSTNSAARQLVYKSSLARPAISAVTEQVSPGAIVNPSWNIICGVFNSAGDDSLYTNGVAFSTALTAGSQSLDGLTLLTSFNNNGPMSSGEYIGEVIVYNRNLNSTEIGQVHTYINGRWSIY